MLMYLYYDLKDLFRPSEILIDSFVFRLHTRITAFALFVCCLVSSGSMMMGETILCWDSNGDHLPEYINTSCWNESAVKVATDGIYKAVNLPRYYQWVPIILCIQGILCCAPRYLWKICEKKRLEQLTFGLNYYIHKHEDLEIKKQLIIGYFLASNGENVHWAYSTYYLVCEVLCLVNVLSQIFLVNFFLGGECLIYAWKVFTYIYEKQINNFYSMFYMFLMIMKCEYFTPGPTGSLMEFDALCVMNNINEMIYAILWFWYVFLGLLLTLEIFFRLLIAIFPFLRVLLLQNQLKRFRRSYSTASIICQWADIGDFWIIYRLGINIKGFIFNDILQDITDALKMQNMVRMKNRIRT